MKKELLLTPEEEAELLQQGVDVILSLSILNDYNQGLAGRTPPEIPKGIPEIDGKAILDLKKSDFFLFSDDEISHFKQSYPEAASYLNPLKGQLSRADLIKAGTALLPRFAYGFLNGGSATSYGDIKKNRGFSPDLFDLYEEEFTRLSAHSRGKPKGVTPGFLQADGLAGPSYMELKLRSLLVLIKSYRDLTGKEGGDGIPFFQMTSVSNDEEVQEALHTYRESPWLKDLAASLNIPPFEAYTAMQPLITAYSHSSQGEPKQIFRNKESKFPFITLPGGHGQCFRVLKETWQKLYDKGTRFISLGNIDNLGYTLDPLELALLAIKDSPAGFDESYKTAVDVKGGILVVLKNDSLSCVDLGVGISFDEAAVLESSGKKILFNCGTGLFNLTWLLENIDRIVSDLPLRFSDQNKDAGLYSQAEQVTWEVIGMIKNPLIFAVDKYERFLAAKILLENMMTSGLKLDDPSFPHADKDLSLTARNLHRGLETLLRTQYGLTLKNNVWVPVESITNQGIKDD
ncbi:UTP--glucose-1-phosphate uridylyltransferase [Oceanispirochaeta sp.]|uniref:UTP--glucose-1-phosphate uridylyltransferase n=1 Tax=Oceanispirochaeta sp. TaxID=2035350 RepID=UPI00262ADADC|nr:UTP--glucose-1-phosphate uridylyltransferase [Oceanispirochaeta sp.]MDA3957691.1 UTP--glucose-1-phosphate uridylyltransferase [Oceanispirochaeta sp.]